MAGSVHRCSAAVSLHVRMRSKKAHLLQRFVLFLRRYRQAQGGRQPVELADQDVAVAVLVYLQVI